MEAEPPPSDHPRTEVGRRLPELPLAVRIVLIVVGWVVVLIGIAGLALPGIQGCVTLVLGAAILSLTSELVYRGMRRVLHRWPRLWARVERLRHWMHAKLSPRDRSEEDSG